MSDSIYNSPGGVISCLKSIPQELVSASRPHEMNKNAPPGERGVGMLRSPSSGRIPPVKSQGGSPLPGLCSPWKRDCFSLLARAPQGFPACGQRGREGKFRDERRSA
jgi:hypothetical protein